ncbi:prolyl oligopeptidase family protein [Actinidia rufa]|uniref:Prolyl oligopeptidase family protein n=1 Tax=Actinidia rufa TaxID=165716 RepID=A0A7J0G190_9ERIC|nr:prolyl oligopeptidase family protein [Actinidia rufa]
MRGVWRLCFANVFSLFLPSFVWVDNSTLLVCTIPLSRGDLPKKPLVPSCPNIQSNEQQNVVQVRTFQNLLKDEYDEDMIEYYATTQLVLASLDGTVKLISPPAVYTSMDPSPDQKYLLITSIHRPYSFIVPCERFPKKVDVWIADGKFVRELCELSLSDDIPIAFNSVRKGMHSISWRVNKPSMLYWYTSEILFFSLLVDDFLMICCGMWEYKLSWSIWDCMMQIDNSEAILLGFQHYLVMLGTTVLIPAYLVPQMGGGNLTGMKRRSKSSLCLHTCVGLTCGLIRIDKLSVFGAVTAIAFSPRLGTVYQLLCYLTGTPEGTGGSRNKNRSTEDVHKSSLCDFPPLDNLKEIPPAEPIKLRIKSKKVSRDPESPYQLKFITPREVLTRAGGDLMSERLPCMEDNLILGVPEEDEGFEQPSHRGVKSNWSRSNAKGSSVRWGEKASKAANHNYDSGSDIPAADAIRRIRSTGLKATSRETHAMNHKFKVRQGLRSAGTSKSAEKILQENIRLAPFGRVDEKSKNGDQFQGHQGYFKANPLTGKSPRESIKRNIRAVEICLVEGFRYCQVPGAGDGGCKIALKFTDPSSSVFGEGFKFTLAELKDFLGFVVERTRYDAAILRHWTCKDECKVWWRDPSGEGGSGWKGWIVSSQVVHGKDTRFSTRVIPQTIIRIKLGTSTILKICGSTTILIMKL